MKSEILAPNSAPNTSASYPLTFQNDSRFNELYADFLKSLDTTEKTKETYTRALKQFFKYMLVNKLTRPLESDIIEYKRHLEKLGRSSTTVQSYLIAVKQFFKYTHKRGVYPDIAKDVKAGAGSNDFKKDYLRAHEVAHLLETIDTSDTKGRRDYAMISLLVTAGLRTIELHRADINDLEHTGRGAKLYVQGKGRKDKDEYIKVIPQVYDALKNYLIDRGINLDDKQTIKENDTPLFTSTSNNSAGKRITTRTISGVVKTNLVKAGYDSDRLTAHSLRHTAGTLNLLNGGTIEETQQLLRHKDISTTTIYLHHLERDKNNSEQRIADAIFNS